MRICWDEFDCFIYGMFIWDVRWRIRVNWRFSWFVGIRGRGGCFIILGRLIFLFIRIVRVGLVFLIGFLVIVLVIGCCWGLRIRMLRRFLGDFGICIFFRIRFWGICTGLRVRYLGGEEVKGHGDVDGCGCGLFLSEVDFDWGGIGYSCFHNISFTKNRNYH